MLSAQEGYPTSPAVWKSIVKSYSLVLQLKVMESFSVRGTSMLFAKSMNGAV